MKEKLKSALVRALWTMLQTAIGVIGADFATPANIDIWAIAVAVLSAGAVSFVKSMGIGMPETALIETDGTIEVAVPRDGSGLLAGGVTWNKSFDLSERIKETHPTISLSVKPILQGSEDAYRQLRN